MRGVYVRLKTTSEEIEIKIARREGLTTNDQLYKYNSVKHVQRQQFSFTKTSIESKVSLKTISPVSLFIF